MRHLVVPMQLDDEAARLDALLPQFQCRQCGYVDCAHYAQALARKKASPTLCTPGGKRVAEELARFMRVLLPENIVFEERAAQCVEIIEADCIGCTRCLRECPLDALIGASKRMHSVLPLLCSGCGLCIPACPVDCMKLVPTAHVWTNRDADDARTRYHARLQRLLKQSLPRMAKQDETHKRRQAVQEALSKARARRLQWAQQRGEKNG